MEKINWLFIHGAGGSASTWRYLENEWDEPAQFINLGGRKEEPATDQQSVEAHAASLKPLLKPSSVVVGHSLGGLIALELARQKEVIGAVLIGSHFTLPVHEKALAKLEKGQYPEGLLLASFAAETPEELREEERKYISQVKSEQTYHDFLICDQYSNGKKALTELSVPILCLYGCEDKLIPPGAASALFSHHPEVKQTFIPGTGHYPMLEKPEAVREELLQFKSVLQKQGGYSL
ncbi:alpha/beta fold hydrolase [Alkalicoccus daliensis]|uniref:Pimeloyl-ACP methyl ester carboxylesterase n=1 Tax=Alkalicoccus daliensis TaxID=745820 RepID=A0A1H0F538_9BACI|nr:alpha/beta hydrolase [Alkalicoccus daliensis]SDN89701.1 Pimeloyl-ACP methyl ester carboxylesterase [Alkalicoccus daliensis]